MKRDWLIIPEYGQKEEFAELAEKYQAGFEYNDFFIPQIYEDEEEVKKRIAGYRSLSRDRSKDTLHGAFLDVVVSSDDTYIAEYSKKRLRQSMDIARRLEIKGVVFHSGLVRGVTSAGYINNWLQRQEAFCRALCSEYPELTIYMENTLETQPEYLRMLIERMDDCSNFMFCLDYAHAVLSGAPTKQWVQELGAKTGHMHINDNDLYADLHQVPGEGRIDWQAFKTEIQVLKQSSVLIELNGLERQRKSLEYLERV